jgi:hypothetical protein
MSEPSRLLVVWPWLPNCERKPCPDTGNSKELLALEGALRLPADVSDEALAKEGPRAPLNPVPTA